MTGRFNFTIDERAGESGEAGLPEKIDERFDQAQEIAVAADAL